MTKTRHCDGIVNRILVARHLSMSSGSATHYRIAQCITHSSHSSIRIVRLPPHMSSHYRSQPEDERTRDPATQSCDVSSRLKKRNLCLPGFDLDSVRKAGEFSLTGSEVFVPVSSLWLSGSFCTQSMMMLYGHSRSRFRYICASPTDGLCFWVFG